MLAEAAELLLDRWHGDLRRLRADAGGNPEQICALLTDFKGMGGSRTADEVKQAGTSQ